MSRTLNLFNLAASMFIVTHAVLPVAGVWAAGGQACSKDGNPSPPARVRIEPVARVSVVTEPAPTPEVQARDHVAAARRAFEQRDYAAALGHADRVVQLVPKNPDARQLRSLILFAMSDYKRSAAEAYDAILLGPVWNWATLSSLYADVADYTQQYRGLQTAAANQPKSLEVHFLLAYHYLMLGHLKQGEAELAKVLEIKPAEPVSAQLLQVVRQAQVARTSQVANSETTTHN